MNISIKGAIILGMMLAFGSRDLAAFHIRLYPAADVYDPDTEVLHERLGLTGQQLLVEDFETTVLQPWLHANLRVGGGQVITTVLTVWTHVCQQDPPSLMLHLPTQQATPKN